MTSYQNDIMDLLHGDTPKAKYEYLLTIISERDKFAIEFAEWIDMELWSSEQGGKWICFDDESHTEIKSKQATTQDLLNLFKQSKLQGDNSKK